MNSSKTGHLARRRLATRLAGLVLSVTSLTAFVVPQITVWHHSGVVVASRR